VHDYTVRTYSPIAAPVTKVINEDGMTAYIQFNLATAITFAKTLPATGAVAVLSK
jgi:hypothetical protein